ncbi:hypothetical protein B5X24_HaOG212499 [Helicoverpa armigera]|nr:hypothetical protein B5X24_HaOG212499 [Helicoverpa armigera]
MTCNRHSDTLTYYSTLFQCRHPIQTKSNSCHKRFWRGRGTALARARESALRPRCRTDASPALHTPRQ